MKIMSFVTKGCRTCWTSSVVLRNTPCGMIFLQKAASTSILFSRFFFSFFFLFKFDEIKGEKISTIIMNYSYNH